MLAFIGWALLVIIAIYIVVLGVGCLFVTACWENRFSWGGFAVVLAGAAAFIATLFNAPFHVVFS